MATILTNSKNNDQIVDYLTIDRNVTKLVITVLHCNLENSMLQINSQNT